MTQKKYFKMNVSTVIIKNSNQHRKWKYKFSPEILGHRVPKHKCSESK